MEKVKLKWKFAKSHNQIVLFLVPRPIILTILSLKSSTLSGQDSMPNPPQMVLLLCRERERNEVKHKSLYASCCEDKMGTTRHLIRCRLRRDFVVKQADGSAVLAGGRQTLELPPGSLQWREVVHRGKTFSLLGNSCGISGKTFLHLEFLWNLLLCF